MGFNMPAGGKEFSAVVFYCARFRFPACWKGHRSPFLKATRLSWFFTEITEIRILRNMGRPNDNSADRADWFISADEAREWQRQQDENEARIRR